MKTNWHWWRSGTNLHNTNLTECSKARDSLCCCSLFHLVTLCTSSLPRIGPPWANLAYPLPSMGYLSASMGCCLPFSQHWSISIRHGSYFSQNGFPPFQHGFHFTHHKTKNLLHLGFHNLVSKHSLSSEERRSSRLCELWELRSSWLPVLPDDSWNTTYNPSVQGNPIIIRLQLSMSATPYKIFQYQMPFYFKYRP